MRLNEVHIELLKNVRERMFKDAENGTEGTRPYICWNLWLVHNELQYIPKYALFESLLEQEGNEEIRTMIEAIEAAINGNVTFSNWLDNQTDGLCLVTEWKHAYVLGRLAWLDRMIERRVIA